MISFGYMICKINCGYSSVSCIYISLVMLQFRSSLRFFQDPLSCVTILATTYQFFTQCFWMVLNNPSTEVWVAQFFFHPRPCTSVISSEFGSLPSSWRVQHILTLRSWLSSYYQENIYIFIASYSPSITIINGSENSS